MKLLFVLSLASSITLSKLCSQCSDTGSQFIDTSVVGISLLHSPDSKVLGTLRYEDGEGGERVQYVQISNKGKDELLILSAFPKTHRVTSYCFYYLKVSEADSQRIQQSTFERFTSGRGVSLGISQSELMCYLGKPHKVEHIANVTSCEYRIADKSSSFLQSHRADEYSSSYNFIDDKLVQVLVQLYLP